MFEATTVNLVIGLGTIIFSIGGAWSLIRAGVIDNTRRIESLESSRSGIYEKLNNQGERLASIESKVDILLERKK